MKITNYILKLVFLFLIPQVIVAQNTVTMSGYVKDKISKEDLIGAVIHIKGVTKGVSTNDYGFYSINVPLSDSIEIIVASLGYEQYHEKIKTQNSNFKKDILLNSQITTTEVIKVVSKKHPKRLKKLK